MAIGETPKYDPFPHGLPGQRCRVAGGVKKFFIFSGIMPFTSFELKEENFQTTKSTKSTKGLGIRVVRVFRGS
jgi:hypothetical protein